MEIISTLFFFILMLFILVTVHEFGHFAAAKLFGMRVEKFFIGFDFWNLRVWSVQRGETEYGIGAIPLGGYVKIAGMVDESMDTDFASKPPQPWEFRAKPVWQRLIVISAGVIMNMILACVIFIGIALTHGEAKTRITTGAFVDKNSVFEEMGIKTGDRITEINGKPVKYWDEVLGDPDIYMNQTLTYTVQRGTETLKFEAPSNMLTRMNDARGEGLRPMIPPYVSGVSVGLPADKAGIRAGSVVLKVDSVDVTDQAEMRAIIGASKGKELLIEWKTAEGEMKSAKMVPTDAGIIGVNLGGIPEDAREYTQLGFGAAVWSGIQQTGKNTASMVKGIGRLFSGQEDVRKSLGGPVRIASMVGETTRQGGALGFFFFVAMFSINLALLNILPFPALDGGQFVMNAVEGVIGREVPLKIKMVIQQVGVTALLILMAFVFLNDIFHF